jgi:hypothetical protein
MDGIDSAIDRVLKAKIGDRIKARLDALIEQTVTETLEGEKASSTTTVLAPPPAPAPTWPAAPSPAPTKRRAGPKAKPTKAKRTKPKASPAVESSKSAARSKPGEGPRAEIVKLLEDGPLNAEEFATALAGVSGSIEARRQAVQRLVKAGNVQRAADGSYKLVRPT